jgi:hypothetical protein
VGSNWSEIDNWVHDTLSSSFSPIKHCAKKVEKVSLFDILRPIFTVITYHNLEETIHLIQLQALLIETMSKNESRGIAAGRVLFTKLLTVLQQ